MRLPWRTAAQRLTVRAARRSLDLNMKAKGAAKHFILAFVLALAGYILFYLAIEHQRTRKGPWQVTFTQSPAGAPTLLIVQPRLNITNVQITFPGEPFSITNASGALAYDDARVDAAVTNHPLPRITLLFAQPRPVPYAVPFGTCVFMDGTFLPGTLTFDLFGHEIELLPRALIIDRQDHPWQSGATLTLAHAPAAPSQAQPPSQ